MRIRTPPGSRPLLLVILLALAGCGGDGSGDDAAPATAPQQPRLEAPTAERLAVRSDAIAARIAAGDQCGAAQEADALAADAIAAVNAGEVPGPYQEELVARTQELVNAVNCPPPPVQQQPAAVEDDDDDGDRGRGKKKGKDKHEKNRRDGDDG